MIADDIAAALPELRAQAESMMVDACLITTAGAPTWDDATGTYTPGSPTTVYEGKCRVRNANPAPQGTDAGETVWAVDLIVVSLPLVGSEAVADGHEVTFTAAQDPALLTVRAVVQAGHVQTYSTARRVPCQVVSRDV